MKILIFVFATLMIASCAKELDEQKKSTNVVEINLPVQWSTPEHDPDAQLTVTLAGDEYNGDLSSLGQTETREDDVYAIGSREDGTIGVKANFHMNVDSTQNFMKFLLRPDAQYFNVTALKICIGNECKEFVDAQVDIYDLEKGYSLFYHNRFISCGGEFVQTFRLEIDRLHQMGDLDIDIQVEGDISKRDITTQTVLDVFWPQVEIFGIAPEGATRGFLLGTTKQNPATRTEVFTSFD